MNQLETEFETVTDYLSWDHDRIEVLLGELYRTVLDGEIERAASLVEEVATDLERHIRIEEQILFPLFEARVAKAGPTDVMRHEHHMIRAALAAIAESLERGDRAAFTRAHQQLESVLGPHDFKEERVLYPSMDRALSADERRELITRLQAARRP